MSITEAPCNLAQQWSYNVPLAPKLNDGLYSVQHTITKKYLTATQNSNTISLSDTMQPFFVFTANSNTNLWTTVYAGKGDGPDDNPFGKVITMDKNAPLQINNQTEDSQGIYLLQDGSIYSSLLGVYYLPSSDNSSVIPGNGKGVWTIQPVSCSPGSVFQDGNYMISINNKYLTNNNQLLTLTASQPSITTWQNYIWKYYKNTLSNCAQLLAYDIVNQKFVLTTAPTLVTLSGDPSKNSAQIAINTTALTANARGTIISAWACGSAGSIFTVTPFSGSKSPESLPSGTYQLQTVDSKGAPVCINSSGQLDSTCDPSSSFWNYDASTNKLQNTKTQQCLLNTSTNVCSLSSLTVGDCKSNGSDRFVLGTDNSLFDPVLGMCYNPTDTQTENFDLSLSPKERKKKKHKRLLGTIFHIIAFLLIILLIVIIVKSEKATK